MAKQAKTLTEKELRRVLDHIATRSHAVRNRAMLLTLYYAGMRVGSVLHCATKMCWMQRARCAAKSALIPNRQRDGTAEWCLSAKSCAKS